VLKHAIAVGVALGGGLVGVVLFFLAGSVSGRGEIGILAGALLLFSLSWQIGSAFRPSRWYAGAVTTVPIWALFLGAASGEFRLYVPGLLFTLAVATAGAVFGARAAGRPAR
jgi:hypothetical protein